MLPSWGTVSIMVPFGTEVVTITIVKLLEGERVGMD